MTRNKTAFASRLKSETPILLDGGLSNQLESQGVDLNNPLWTALLLKESPAEIIAAHRHYLEAGADCLITASYQASFSGFKATGLSDSECNSLIKLSVELANTAVGQFLKDKPEAYPRPLIAASIGPYGASLADGSEYTGRYDIDEQQLLEFHQQRLMLLDSTDADVFACETIPSFQEAQILQTLLEKVETPAWISFSCKDAESIHDGTPIEESAVLFRGHPKVKAIGVNCTSPQYINELIGRIRNVTPELAIVVYPNSGEKYDAQTKSWSGTTSPQSCGEAALSWIRSGAAIVGGCCRMGPKHIRAMKQHCHKL